MDVAQQSSSFSTLQHEISQWEHTIRVQSDSNCPDPLDTHFKFICWLESHLSTHRDLEERFKKAVEACLSIFDKHENYKQDLRMVKLWIKYIDFQPNPLNLYKILYQKGIGTTCSAFYIGWAHYFNSANHFKQAESIFNLGIQLKAQPISELENAQKSFRFSIAQRMLYNDESSKKRTISSLAEQRQQITSLSPHQQHPAKRVKIEELPASSSGSQSDYYQLPIDDIRFTFEHGFQATSNFCTYAQNSHDPWNCQLTLEEPYDPNQRVFYQKNLVYPGNGQEYSPEEIKAQKYYRILEEKRQADELGQRQEQERLRQQAEAKRLMEEQERIRLEQQKKQQQYQHYQQQQQQQTWNQQQTQPSNYNSYYPQQQQQNYENSPQYSYHHDHMYQSHYANNSYQNSPQTSNYQNSPQQSAVVVNQNQMSGQNSYQHQNYQYQQQGYHQSSPQVHQNYQQSPQVVQQTYQNSPHTSSYQASPHVHPQMQNNYQNNSQSYNHGYSNQNHYYSTNHYPTQYQNYQQPHSYENTQNWSQSQSHPQAGYQDVEYLIDDQNEIDPKMLQQPIVEKKVETESESEEYTGPAPIVRSYMLDDLEDQIEASTISFSSNGKSRDKKITIKFRKEKTTNLMKIVNSDQSNSLEPSSSSSSSSGDKRKNRVDLMDDNTQFMPSATNSSSSVNNVDYGRTSFNGCVTPVRKSNKSSNVFKSLKKTESFVSQNNDSNCSFNGEQNSFFQAENDEDFRTSRLEKALAVIEEHTKKKPSIDPFNAELCRSLLVKLNFPSRDTKEGYKISNVNLPKLVKNHLTTIGGVNYQIEKEVGRGAFGAVFRGINTIDGSVVALKYQKPPNSWELYICTEAKKRLKNPDILPGFMSISAAVLAPNASILISEFSQFGSLLDINNRIRQATTKVMHESLAMHFSSQILNIIHHLHSCKIIHADIKPDNFLLMTLPSADTWIPSLRLIDFGCAIDMTLFDEGTEFQKIIQTDGFTCTEMQEGKSWSYQTDLFCIAATIHVMLFGEYMQVSKKFGSWEIKQKFPRYLNKNVWGEVFPKLLNVPDKDHLPNLMDLKFLVDNETNENELIKHIRAVSNLIRKR